LIERDKWPHWRNEIHTDKHYRRYASQLSTYTGPIEETWLTHDNIVFMTRLELDFAQRDVVLNITVSKGVEDTHARRPIWFYSRP
jgi:hypothetical protein